MGYDKRTKAALARQQKAVKEGIRIAKHLAKNGRTAGERAEAKRELKRLQAGPKG